MGKFTNEHYVNEIEMRYEVILSKGKGTLTPKLEKMLILIVEGVAKKMFHRYNDDDMRYDVKMGAILTLFSNWKNIDMKKYELVLPYYTEIVKRGFTYNYNKLRQKRQGYDYPQFTYIDKSYNF